MKNFIKNIWNFRKFLWENRWWDYSFIFFMLREKLKIDVKYYKRHSINKYACDQIKRMNLCIKVLNRILEHDYTENALSFFEKDYPDWHRTKNYDKKRFVKCLQQEERQQKQDIEYLFKLLTKYIRTWWD